MGETKRRLKDRFNEHRRPVDNPSNISKPTTVSEHFLTNDHSAIDERPYKKKNYGSTDWYGRAEQDCNLLPLSYNVRHGTQRN